MAELCGLRMPIQTLVADIPMDDFPRPMEDHIAQPWDCESRNHSVIVMDRVAHHLGFVN